MPGYNQNLKSVTKHGVDGAPILTSWSTPGPALTN